MLWILGRRNGSRRYSWRWVIVVWAIFGIMANPGLVLLVVIGGLEGLWDIKLWFGISLGGVSSVGTTRDRLGSTIGTVFVFHHQTPGKPFDIHKLTGVPVSNFPPSFFIISLTLQTDISGNPLTTSRSAREQPVRAVRLLTRTSSQERRAYCTKISPDPLLQTFQYARTNGFL